MGSVKQAEAASFMLMMSLLQEHSQAWYSVEEQNVFSQLDEVDRGSRLTYNGMATIPNIGIMASKFEHCSWVLATGKLKIYKARSRNAHWVIKEFVITSCCGFRVPICTSNSRTNKPGLNQVRGEVFQT
ncbi:hypothetical protein BD779DRAFT_1558832 [Infundibulicybe gibba]|nr:hypothetical protein BD779DRAFT_1558832 [Infundibulicybe gibba]